MSDIQKKYMEFQQLNNKVQQQQQQLTNLGEQLLELGRLATALDDIKKAKTGSEVLAPIGSGMYARTNLEKNDEIIMHIGSHVNVTKTPQEAKEIIKQQQEEIKKISENMKKELQEGIIKLQMLQQELQQGQKK